MRDLFFYLCRGEILNAYNYAVFILAYGTNRQSDQKQANRGGRKIAFAAILGVTGCESPL